MKKNILFICLSIILFSCQKDDLSWKNEILNIKNQLYVQQQLINALQDGITIKSITPSDNGYSISFSNGTSISLSDGKTPIISIGKDGFWYINEINTNVTARGIDGVNGKDGIIPTIFIGNNGNWIINNVDSGVKANGKNGTDGVNGINGTNGTNGTVGADGINSPMIISIAKNSTSFIFYLDNGNKIIVSNSKKKISCWGDSITWGAAPEDGKCWAMLLQQLLGDSIDVINCGVGGESAISISARMGAIPMYNSVEFTLPSTVNTLVPVGRNDAWVYNGFFKSSYDDAFCPFLLQGEGRDYNTINPCFIDGIECTLSYSIESQNPIEGQYYIKRNQTGDARVINIGTPVYTNAAKNLKSDALVLFMGTNGGFQSVEELIEKNKRMIEFSGVNNNYIIIGIYGGAGYPFPIYMGKSEFEAMEKKFFATFGLHYINLRKYAIEHALADAGIIPTSSDINAIALGHCPPSLIPDGIHPNSTFSKLIANLVHDTMTNIGIF